MEIQRCTITSYMITLNKKEAEWLIGVLQNPICENEIQPDTDMRELLYTDLVTLVNDKT